MDPARIKALREQTGENTTTFAARFSRSGRTVEDWEQGRRNPDPLAVSILTALESKLAKRAKNKSEKIR